MTSTRREFFVMFLKRSAALAAVMALPRDAHACLGGVWVIHCPNCGQNDTVTGGTCQHVCENSKCQTQVFDGSKVTVVCPQGHLNRIDTVNDITSFHCRTAGCGQECRRETKAKPERPDRGGR